MDKNSQRVGEVDSIEMVTIGQRKGLGLSGQGDPKYAVDIDVENATVTVGQRSDLFSGTTKVRDLCWVDNPHFNKVQVQTSAHGKTTSARIETDVHWMEPHLKVAPGQSLVFYNDDLVVGSAIAT